MDKKEITKEKLIDATDKGAFIVFTKKDGTERKMKCTTNWKIVALADPTFIPPKGEKETKPFEGTIMVWDLEKHGFRIITIDKVKEIEPL